MSTIVVAKKNNQVAIGSDTLTKLGCSKESALYVKNCGKILNIGKSKLAYVGHASWGHVIKNALKCLDKIQPIETEDDVFDLFNRLHVIFKEKYFLYSCEKEDDPFESSRINCLIANSLGIFGVYNLRSVNEYLRFYAFGSGSEYAMGAMHAIYEKENSVKNIVEAGLKAAEEFDDSTGSPFEIYVIKMSK